MLSMEKCAPRTPRRFVGRDAESRPIASAVDPLVDYDTQGYVKLKQFDHLCREPEGRAGAIQERIHEFDLALRTLTGKKGTHDRSTELTRELWRVVQTGSFDELVSAEKVNPQLRDALLEWEHAHADELSQLKAEMPEMLEEEAIDSVAQHFLQEMRGQYPDGDFLQANHAKRFPGDADIQGRDRHWNQIYQRMDDGKWPVFLTVNIPKELRELGAKYHDRDFMWKAQHAFRRKLAEAMSTDWKGALDRVNDTIEAQMERLVDVVGPNHFLKHPQQYGEHNIVTANVIDEPGAEPHTGVFRVQMDSRKVGETVPLKERLYAVHGFGATNIVPAAAGVELRDVQQKLDENQMILGFAFTIGYRESLVEEVPLEVTPPGTYSWSVTVPESTKSRWPITISDFMHMGQRAETFGFSQPKTEPVNMSDFHQAV